MRNPVPDATPPALPLQIASVRREIARRQMEYPRLISAGKIKTAEARHELDAMTAALASLEHLRDQLRAGSGAGAA